MKMKELFDRGEFAVSAEVGPPKGIHVNELVEEAKTYLTGVHAVNVTDNPEAYLVFPIVCQKDVVTTFTPARATLNA